MLGWVLFSMSVTSQWAQGPCTAHFYEDLRPLGGKMDYNPGWCGTRYTMLNLARITAVHGIGASGCNQCLEVQNANGGPSVFVWAVDKKEAPGLDIARESFRLVTPGADVLDPQVCRWKVVEPSRCGKVCYGSAEECGVGVRNLLPYQLLPELPPAPFGIGTSQPPTNRVPVVPVPEQPVVEPNPVQQEQPKPTTVLTRTVRNSSRTRTVASSTSASASFSSQTPTTRPKSSTPNPSPTPSTTTSETSVSYSSPTIDSNVGSAGYSPEHSSALHAKPLLYFIAFALLQ